MNALKEKQGFSLVELSIALMVATIFVLGIFSLYSQNILSTKKMDQRFMAINLAKSRLERLRSMDFNNLSLANETDTYLNAEGNSDGNGDFKRNTQVATNYNGMTDLTQVTVTVDYRIKGVFTGKPVVLTTVYVDE